MRAHKTTRTGGAPAPRPPARAAGAPPPPVPADPAAVAPSTIAPASGPARAPVASLTSVATLLATVKPQPEAQNIPLEFAGAAAVQLAAIVREAPFADRLAVLPELLWRPECVDELERLGLAASATTPDPEDGRAARKALMRDGVALRKRLRRAARRVFDEDDAVWATLKGMGRDGWRPVGRDLLRLRDALLERPDAWADLEDAVSGDDLEDAGPMASALLAAAAGPRRSATVETLARLRTALRDRFRFVRAAARFVTMNLSDVPALPRLVESRRRNPADVAAAAEAKQAAAHARARARAEAKAAKAAAAEARMAAKAAAHRARQATEEAKWVAAQRSARARGTPAPTTPVAADPASTATDANGAPPRGSTATAPPRTDGPSAIGGSALDLGSATSAPTGSAAVRPTATPSTPASDA
jgi:hypothetical protein